MNEIRYNDVKVGNFYRILLKSGEQALGKCTFKSTSGRHLFTLVSWETEESQSFEPSVVDKYYEADRHELEV